MGKSADAFRTISEVAEWLGVQAHVLRFWESKFSQIKPVKRAGGRRYYRPNDMLLIGGIKHLLHDDGLTIKGVQKILRDEGVAHVAEFSKPLDDIVADDEPAARPAAKKPAPKPQEAAAPEPAAPVDASEQDNIVPDDTSQDDVQSEAPFIDAAEEPSEAEVVPFAPATEKADEPETVAAPTQTAAAKDTPEKPADHDQSDPTPGVLHHAFACKRLTEDEANAIQPMLERLQGLRDQMAAQR